MPVSKAVVFSIIYLKTKMEITSIQQEYTRSPKPPLTTLIHTVFKINESQWSKEATRKRFCMQHQLTTNKININCYKRRCHSEVVHCMIVALLSALWNAPNQTTLSVSVYWNTPNFTTLYIFNGMLQTRRQSLYLINGMLQSR